MEAYPILEARTVPIDGFVSLARAGPRRVFGIGCRFFSFAFKFQNSLVTKGQIQRSFSNSPMKKPSVANGGEIALSISISCEANFSFLLSDHVLGCRRSGS